MSTLTKRAGPDTHKTWPCWRLHPDQDATECCNENQDEDMNNARQESMGCRHNKAASASATTPDVRGGTGGCGYGRSNVFTLDSCRSLDPGEMIHPDCNVWLRCSRIVVYPRVGNEAPISTWQYVTASIAGRHPICTVEQIKAQGGDIRSTGEGYNHLHRGGGCADL